MKKEWTKEQKEVLDARNSSLLVSAAAGSGKTAVLSSRIVSLLTDKEHPLEIDRILVVTFTNLAAAEMRERISE
jgi:ATP-dependent helicase/nuclease subunit A